MGALSNGREPEESKRNVNIPVRHWDGAPRAVSMAPPVACLVRDPAGRQARREVAVRGLDIEAARVAIGKCQRDAKIDRVYFAPARLAYSQPSSASGRTLAAIVAAWALAAVPSRTRPTMP